MGWSGWRDDFACYGFGYDILHTDDFMNVFYDSIKYIYNLGHDNMWGEYFDDQSETSTPWFVEDRMRISKLLRLCFGGIDILA